MSTQTAPTSAWPVQTVMTGLAFGESPRWHAGAAKQGVVVPVRRWEDYLALGITEIREFGATSIQVMRRLRAVLEDLMREVRPENRAAVAAEIARLDATVEAGFSGSIDLDRAGIADRQGLGGPERLGNVEPAPGRALAPADRS